jgi:drug/metabolite transporter (DMT)-like permease
MSRAIVALTVSAVLMLPLAVAGGPVHVLLLPTVSVIVAGVVFTGAGMVLFYTLINRIGSRKAALSAYLAPIFSLLAGYALLDEAITAGALVGTGFIIAGVALASQPRRGVAAVPAIPRARPRPA